jgi:hypothetical protein
VRSLAVFHLGGVGGPHRSLVQALSWLHDRGTLEIIVPEEGPTAREYAPLGAVTVADYSALTYARGLRGGLGMTRELARDVRMFRRELRQRRPDVVVAVTTVLPAVLIAARLERVPSVVYAAEVYGQDWKRAPLLRVWGAGLAGMTAALAGALVCCSQTVADQFPRRRGRSLTIAYPPIGAEYADGDRARGRGRYGVEEADPCLLVVGSLSRGRGQDVAIEALARLRPRFPGARLLVLGAPHPRQVDLAFAEELERLTGELGVADAVVFAGVADEMADAYAAADVVLNPARFAEPFGRVAPEALAAGRPVVASRVGALPEVIRDEVEGLLVPPDDADALAKAVARLVDDRAFAESLVESGRRMVRERFGYEQDLAAWTEAFESVVPGQKAPRPLKTAANV